MPERAYRPSANPPLPHPVDCAQGVRTRERPAHEHSRSVSMSGIGAGQGSSHSTGTKLSAEGLLHTGRREGPSRPALRRPQEPDLLQALQRLDPGASQVQPGSSSIAPDPHRRTSCRSMQDIRHPSQYEGSTSTYGTVPYVSTSIREPCDGPAAIIRVAALYPPGAGPAGRSPALESAAFAVSSGSRQPDSRPTKPSHGTGDR